MDRCHIDKDRHRNIDRQLVNRYRYRDRHVFVYMYTRTRMLVYTYKLTKGSESYIITQIDGTPLNKQR